MAESLPRVFVLGSSLTIQFGPYLERALEGRFHYDRKRATDGRRAEDNLDIPQGASGGDSGQVLAYLRERRESDPIRADYLVLNCGLHDMRTDPATGEKNVPVERFEANLREAVEEVRATGATLVWLRITPVVDEVHNTRQRKFHRFAADVDRYNAVADRIMAEAGTGGEAGARVIDLHAFCQRFVPHGFIDHIHYDEAAREAQARYIAEHLDAYEAERRRERV